MTEKEFLMSVKIQRERLFLSQKDFARQIPLSKSTYCKIENGRQKITFFVLKRIAEILNIDLNSIKDPKGRIFWTD